MIKIVISIISISSSIIICQPANGKQNPFSSLISNEQNLHLTVYRYFYTQKNQIFGTDTSLPFTSLAPPLNQARDPYFKWSFWQLLVQKHMIHEIFIWDLEWKHYSFGQNHSGGCMLRWQCIVGKLTSRENAFIRSPRKLSPFYMSILFIYLHLELFIVRGPIKNIALSGKRD